MASPLPNPPRFGVSAIIFDADGKLLVGQRFGSHGAGEKPQTHDRHADF